jgi:hypothetical protein
MAHSKLALKSARVVRQYLNGRVLLIEIISSNSPVFVSSNRVR